VLKINLIQSVLMSKVNAKYSVVQGKNLFSEVQNTALSFKISHTIPKYPYFIGDIPPICPLKS
jgi:hypothetical protein